MWRRNRIGSTSVLIGEAQGRERTPDSGFAFHSLLPFNSSSLLRVPKAADKRSNGFAATAPLRFHLTSGGSRLGAVGRKWPANVGGGRYRTFASSSCGCPLHLET